MKDRVLLLAATMFLSAHIVSPVLAQESGQKPLNEPAAPTASDLKNSKDRGIYIDPIRARGKAEKEKASSTASTTKAPAAEKATVKVAPKTEDKPVAKKIEKTEVKKAEKTPVKTVKPHEKIEKASVTKPETHSKKAPVARLEIKPVTKHHPVEHDAAKTVVVPKHETTTTPTEQPKTTHSSPSSNGDQIVTAWLNKEGQTPHYRDGENLKVSVSAHKDCNVLIFNYDGNMLTQIFPNKFQTDSVVKAGQTVEIGGTENSFDFQVSNSSKDPSKEKIFVYAYPIERKTEAPLSVALNNLPASPFRSTEYSPEQYRKLVSESKVFFSRSVKVVAKKNVTPVSFSSEEPSAAPNKIELSLVVDGN